MRIVLRDLFLSVRERYEFIIVDSAPVLLVTDTLIVSRLVDCVIFSILREVSQIPPIYAAYERLASLGVRTLGAVVSGVRLIVSRVSILSFVGHTVCEAC